MNTTENVLASEPIAAVEAINAVGVKSQPEFVRNDGQVVSFGPVSPTSLEDDAASVGWHSEEVAGNTLSDFDSDWYDDDGNSDEGHDDESNQGELGDSQTIRIFHVSRQQADWAVERVLAITTRPIEIWVFVTTEVEVVRDPDPAPNPAVAPRQHGVRGWVGRLLAQAPTFRWTLLFSGDMNLFIGRVLIFLAGFTMSSLATIAVFSLLRAYYRICEFNQLFSNLLPS
jgi:hypothetical protein